MARNPVASTETPTGAIRFIYDDGSESYAPAASDYARQLHASLPDAMAGATAENAYTAPPTGNPYLDLPMPSPPTASDASGGAGGAPGYPSTDTGAGGDNWWERERTYAPGEEPITPASGGTPGSGAVGGVAANPRLAGVAPVEPETVTTYAVNPNEGQPPAPRRNPVRVTKVPGQWFPGARQYQSTEVPEEAKDLIQGAQDGASMADQIDLVEKGKTFDAMRTQQTASNVALEYEREQNAKREAARIEEQKRRLAERETEVADIAATEIDAGRYMDSQGTGGRILLGLATFLAGVGNAKQYGGTGTNPVLDMIQKNIARDIDAQKANLATRKGALKEKDNLYGRMLERYGDERTAESAAYAAYQTQVAKGMERLAQQAENPARAAEIMRAKAALDAARGQNILDWESRTVSETEQYQRPQTIVSGGGPAAFKPDRRGAKIYADKREAAQIDKMTTLMEEGRALVSRYKSGEDIPGLRASDRAIVDNTPGGSGVAMLRAIRGKEAADNYQWSIAMATAELRDESGAAFGASEIINKATERTGDGTAEMVNNGISRAERVRDQKLLNIRRGVGPDAVETYEQYAPGQDTVPSVNVQRPGQ